MRAVWVSPPARYRVARLLSVSGDARDRPWRPLDRPPFSVAGEGIAQVPFFEGDERCPLTCADRKDRYQGQQSIVLPRLQAARARVAQ